MNKADILWLGRQVYETIKFSESATIKTTKTKCEKTFLNVKQPSCNNFISIGKVIISKPMKTSNKKKA